MSGGARTVVVAFVGLGMLLYQGALAFELWTGHKPSEEAVWEVVVDVIT